MTDLIIKQIQLTETNDTVVIYLKHLYEVNDIRLSLIIFILRSYFCMIVLEKQYILKIAKKR